MVIFLGPPGAGKSLQGRMLSEAYDWQWLSLGNILRNSADSHYEQVVKSGNLISSQTTYKILERYFETSNFDKLILDGFPRLAEQAEWLINGRYRSRTKLVLVFDVSHEEIIKRLKLRGRSDDNIKAVESRIQLYEKSINEILQVFVDVKIPVVHINGEGEVSEVYNKVVNELLRKDVV